MAEAAFSIVAERIRQQCFDALSPAEKTAVLFAVASGAAAQVQK